LRVIELNLSSKSMLSKSASLLAFYVTLSKRSLMIKF
jgi:hypothetical protein